VNIINNNIRYRLFGAHTDGERVSGCLDAACELILMQLDEPGRIDLASVLSVLEAARSGQDALLDEIARVIQQVDAEYGISEELKELSAEREQLLKGPAGGES